MGTCTGCGAEIHGEHYCDMGAGRTPAEVLRLVSKIESHLSRLASAAESPFWRLFQCSGTTLLKNADGVWIARMRDDEDRPMLEAHGPTPQAAVEKFDEAFKKGTP